MLVNERSFLSLPVKVYAITEINMSKDKRRSFKFISHLESTIDLKNLNKYRHRELEI